MIAEDMVRMIVSINNEHSFPLSSSNSSEKSTGSATVEASVSNHRRTIFNDESLVGPVGLEDVLPISDGSPGIRP